MNKISTLASALFFLLATQGIQAHSVPTNALEINPIEVGTQMPDAAVKLPDGTPVTLSSITDGKPSVLVFYRGGWCPYCNKQLAGLLKIEKELQEIGYQIIALSPDKPATVAKASEEAMLTYQLLSDASLNAAKAFGIAYKVDEATLNKLKTYKIDIVEASGELHNQLPVPAVFLTDAEGKIISRHYDANYKSRIRSDKLLKTAKEAMK